MAKKYSVAKFLTAINGTGNKTLPDGKPDPAGNGCAGIMTIVASRMGCDWHTADHWIQSHLILSQAFKDQENRILDVCEGILNEEINQKNLDVVKWYLSKKGKHRGYGDRVEYFNVDLSTLSDDQIDALAAGEDLAHVLKRTRTQG